MSKIYETEVAGRPLSLEFGKVAGLANGSVLVRYGDTVVVTAATASDKPRDGIDFFPLSIDYEEKCMRWVKFPAALRDVVGRQNTLSLLHVLSTDLCVRFSPKDLRNDVSIVSTVLSVEQDNAPEFCAMIGSSAAVSVSDIPFNGPIAAVYVGLIDGEFIINPTEAQREISEMNLTVAGSKKKVVMIEAGANEVSEDVMFNAIMFAHEEIKSSVTSFRRFRMKSENLSSSMSIWLLTKNCLLTSGTMPKKWLSRQWTQTTRQFAMQDFLLFMMMCITILKKNILRTNSRPR